MLNCDASAHVHLFLVDPACVCEGHWAPNVVFLANDDVLINLLFFFSSQLNSGKACLHNY